MAASVAFGSADPDRLSFTPQERSGNAAAPASDASAQSASPPTAPAPSIRILICDDEALVRDMLQHVLRRHGYLADTAASAEAAWVALNTLPYQLFLCDMLLPGMTGLDLLTRIAESLPGLPVVLMTGQGDVDLMRQALRVGAIDYLPKPFPLERIPLVVERALERHALQTQRSVLAADTVIFSAVQALAAAMDAKEPFTAQHSERVAQYARTLGRQMRLDADAQRTLELAAHVHDVGKIGTPDAILNKPGALNEEEWRAMRQHPIQGAQIVGRVPLLTDVARTVRHHHERMDGAGYPDRLAGEEIPLLSRVIAVVDAYEVMTHDRVYRRGIPPQLARSRLQSAAGSYFDPAIVAAFLAIPPETLPL